MKKQNSYLPFSDKELKLIKNSGDKLSELFLLTGIRRMELKQLFFNPIVSQAIKIFGKGGKYRIIPITPKIKELIQELKPFWSWKTERSINSHFEKLGIVIGLYQKVSGKRKSLVYPHRFRATFATKLINNGIDLVTIQTLMGHSKITTTAEYIKINTNNLRISIEMLSDPKYDLDGMTIFELKQEILRLRKRLNRNKN